MKFRNSLHFGTGQTQVIIQVNDRRMAFIQRNHWLKGIFQCLRKRLFRL